MKNKKPKIIITLPIDPLLSNLKFNITVKKEPQTKKTNNNKR